MKPILLSVARLPAFLTEKLVTHFDFHQRDTLSDAAFAELAPRVQAVAANGESVFTAADYLPLTALQTLAVFGVGYDGIDTTAAAAHGVTVSHTPDVLTDDVADFAFAHMMAIARHIKQADAFVRRGDWQRGPHPFTTRVSGAKLGIVGLGRIGRAIARRAEGFNMRIAYTGRNPQSDVPYRYVASVEALAAEVDFLVVAAPGGADTYHLINAPVLAALGTQGYLINVGRGSLVDAQALAHALTAGLIAGAASDVFENEPNVEQVLLDAPNLLLSPHMASGTASTRLAMADLVVDNLLAHFAGKPLLTPVPKREAR